MSTLNISGLHTEADEPEVTDYCSQERTRNFTPGQKVLSSDGQVHELSHRTVTWVGEEFEGKGWEIISDSYYGYPLFKNGKRRSSYTTYIMGSAAWGGRIPERNRVAG